MKNEDKKRKEEKTKAKIKGRKQNIINRIKEKATIKELSPEENIILLEIIYDNYSKKRMKLMQKAKIGIQEQQEIGKVSAYMLDAIENVLEKEDKESILLLINQNELFNAYYDLIMDKNNFNGKEEIESKLIENNKLVKTN